MVEDQLVILAAIFAARADSTNCETLWTFFHSSDELFDIICSLWPELDDPTKLQFLFDPSEKSSSGHSTNPQDLLVELLETDEQLISMVEMDSDTITQRRQAISRYAAEYMKQVTPYDRIKFVTPMGDRLRKRLITSNELSDQLPMQYHPVWKVVSIKDEELPKWIEGIVEPLDHLNKRLNSSIKIKEFENMDPLSVFDMILNTPDENPDTVLQRELMPYMANGDYYERFLHSFLTTKDFPLNTNYNFEVFYQLILSLGLRGQETNKYLERFKRQCAYILFKNGPNYLNIGTKYRLNQVLLTIGDETPVGDLGITVETLLAYSSLTDKLFHGYHMQDLYAISKDDESVQESHFASLSRKCLETVVSEETTMKELKELLKHGKSSNNVIFSRLSEQKKLSIIIEILLEFGNFSFLHELIITYQYKVNEEVLVKYFWHFFNMASSGQRHKRDLANAEKLVNLLLEENAPKYTHLRILLDVTKDICDYSINWGRSLPFRPSHLLKFKEDPFGLISLLLESNRRLYKDVPATYSILQKLLVAFEIAKQGTTDSEENLVKVLVLHIDHALVNMDFQFAYENTRDLLKKKNIIDCWPTILQVGKFVDPNWRDGETPTEIIFLQLEILGELLQICPVDEVEAVASQWSALELELLTRDLIKDPYSLEKSSSVNSLIQNGVSLNGVSSTIANFLSRS
ncbi:hypothetical protein ZYGR_0H04420 [Zygosaccharomyces rouxii]|uniref:ZYRO0B14190p n=2 Tax=Zygosaccharomyces rouxii TaxID=4956 RepID=C5DS63_ZYGRC|nr:uncharacterized protein ZYRO0B14190g [Zygosaccharomyces rouxii]KAH9199847.1 Sec39 domain-containing protein [Zygosaccharomyces rouxii]GAV47596.1 hypothetical protein ZYGR_0H04420 [Zygosaccharomyces rouxii]CAR26624.1 ZYRO0B14190p [Zygosaccharomyces rouxii]